MLKSICSAIRLFFTKWFWQKPTEDIPEKKAHVMAHEVMHDWDVVTYNGVDIPLRKNEVPIFHALANKDKKTMAAKVQRARSKGRIKIVEIEGKKTVVLNRDYEARADRARR